MKAVVMHEYGGPEVLKYEEVPRPEPKDNEVLVRMIAAGVNPVDALIRSGKYAKFFGTTLPLIPGYDIGCRRESRSESHQAKSWRSNIRVCHVGRRLRGICGRNGGRGSSKAE